LSRFLLNFYFPLAAGRKELVNSSNGKELIAFIPPKGKLAHTGWPLDFDIRGFREPIAKWRRLSFEDR